jgi:hypothetical protein
LRPKTIHFPKTFAATGDSRGKSGMIGSSNQHFSAQARWLACQSNPATFMIAR